MALRSCACCRSTPQLNAGGCIPRPRKLNAVSPRIIPGIESVSCTMMKLRNDGSRWRKMMRPLLQPMTLAAVMKSSDLRERNLPRTIGQVRGIAAESAIHSGSVGTDTSMSMIRMITSSARPPTYPARPPKRRPRTNENAIPTRPIVSEIRPPIRTREKMSLPSPSVPKRKIG